MKKLAIGLVTIGLSSAGTTLADGFDTEYFINGGIGYQYFDERFDIDDELTLTWGVEARLSRNWGVEFSADYSEADNEFGNSSFDAEVGGARLSGVYYFANASKLLPYATLGAGAKAVTFDQGRDDVFTEISGGVGLRYKISDRFHVRGDARALAGLDDDTGGALISLGLSYALGGSGDRAKDNDADRDGVVDRIDKCPNTPAGVAVDASGCALDGDGDGVPNYRDKCPNTEAGAQVDEFGCKFSVTETESIKLRVLFAFDSAEIPQAFTGGIRDVANFMKAHPSVKAVVEGHTDSVGSESYNQGLSQRRADAVRNALINDYGIASNRLSAVGFGEGRPIADNSTSEGRQKNRRVMAVIQVTTEK